MKAQYKLVIALLPFVGAGVFASTHVYPSFLEDQQKRTELHDKKQENDRLLGKLKQSKDAEEYRKSLENEISMLRGSVPKAPELDLFMLDLEKMCNDSKVDLIAVESPNEETQKSIESADEEVDRMVSESANKNKPKPAQVKPPAPNSAKTPPPEDKTALRKLRKEVFVTGDYNDIITLMRKLESYERVTGVKQITIALPKEKDSSEGGEIPAAERAKKLHLNQPVMSFLMTLYYVP